MNTQEKINAIVAAVNEHAAIYAGVRAPVTPATYNAEIVEGLKKCLMERIAAIVLDQE
jgi:hypothetical protein